MTIKHAGSVVRASHLLVVLALVSSMVVARAPHADAEEWSCTPVDPAEAVPADPCFRATVSDTNLVTLEWRVANSAWLVYLHDGAGFHDLGFQLADCTPGAVIGCSTDLRLHGGARRHWTLAVSNASGDRITVPTSVQIVAPEPPEVTGGGHVDMLDPTDQTITWSHPGIDGVADEWIEIPAGLFASPLRYDALSGAGASHSVAASSLKPGETTRQVRYCYEATADTPDDANRLCSPDVTVGFRVEPARWEGPHRVFVSSESGDLTLTHTQDSGSLWAVASSTLVPGGFTFTTSASYTIDEEALTPGHHSIGIVSCQGWQTCSNRVDADRAAAAGVVTHVPPSQPPVVSALGLDYYSAGDEIATVTPPSGPTQTITAPASGHVYFQVEDGATVAANELVALVITPYEDVVSIVVDSPVDWELGRDWQLDFDTGTAHAQEGGGQPLDITYGDDLAGSGGIWQIGEFSTGVDHFDGTTVRPLLVPLLLDADEGFAPVEPFANPLTGPGVDASTYLTALAERITEIDGVIWFTQGGDLLHDGVGHNHSRLVAYDPSSSDSPATQYDDRLCAYNVPGDDNEVVGLTAAGGRIWFAEYRGFEHDSVISSFVPDPGLCDNLLDFNDPGAVVGQELQYCDPGENAEDDACVEVLSLPPGVQAAHVEADPSDGTVWFTDPHGAVLGNVDPTASPPASTWTLPASSSTRDGSLIRAVFKSFPWTLRATDDAVYFGEYLDNDIVRFDKSTETFDEIHLPFENDQIRHHSLALDEQADRLWFTLSNETYAPADPEAGTIGYIDLGSWRDHLDDPVATPTISATTYAGLDDVNTDNGASAAHQTFRGIAVDQGTGNLALASVFRRQIVELEPTSAFRP